MHQKYVIGSCIEMQLFMDAAVAKVFQVSLPKLGVWTTHEV